MGDWNPGDLCQVRRGKRWVDAEIDSVEHHGRPGNVRVVLEDGHRVRADADNIRPRPAPRGKLPEPSENSRKAQEHFAATRESVVVHGGRHIISRPKACPGCRSIDGEHTFGPTCTLVEEDPVTPMEAEARALLKPVPKPTTARSKDYLAHVRTFPCCSCGREEGIHAHHIAGGGMGAKCSDYYTAPLCGVCHQHWHATATLPAQSEFDVVDTDEARATMWEAAARCLEEWITREGE